MQPRNQYPGTSHYPRVTTVNPTNPKVERQRTRHVFVASLLTVLLGLTSCEKAAPSTPANNWDEMKWDEQKWGGTTVVPCKILIS